MNMASGGSTPLVDTGWARGIPDEVAASFTARALQKAERLRTLDPSAESFLAEVHQVRGSAGSVGLPAISEAAAAIEDAGRVGAELAPLVQNFGSVVEETRRELVRLGIVATG